MIVCDLCVMCVWQEEVTTETVATTSKEVFTSTTVCDGLVSEEVVQTTTTTTTTKKATKTISAGGDAKPDKREEQGSGDAPVIPDIDTETKELEIPMQTETSSANGETDAKESGDSNSSEADQTDSATPGVSTKAVNLDGKVSASDKQALLQAAASKTLMVVTKDGKKTLMRVIRQPNAATGSEGALAVVSSSSTTSTEDNLIGT